LVKPTHDPPTKEIHVTIHSLMSQVIIPRDTGLLEDRSMNTFSWYWDDLGGLADYAAVGQALITRLGNFYGGLDEYMSAKNANPVTIKVYDRADPAPRVPRFTGDLPTLTYSASSLPSECAAVISFEATPISGGNQARRRGRVFIGPLSSTTADAAGTDVYLSAAFQAELRLRASNLRGANGSGLLWYVYSDKDGLNRPVERGWVDNAFDIQRRRGPKATARTTWN